MRQRQFVYVLLFLLCGAAAWYLWCHTGPATAQKKSITPAATASRSAPATAKVAARGIVRTNVMHISLAEWNTNKFAGRLSNTTKPIGQLVHDSHAILLENALIDTTKPLNFDFPRNLQSKGDPGAYIVQAKGPIDQAFRQMLAQMGATVVAYIPNDAYLIRGTAASAGMLGGNPLVQAVVPYEPYYKMDSSLLPKAVQQMDLPDDTALNLALYANDSKATISQIEKLGGHVVSQEQSPFGPVVRVIPPRDWTAVVTLPGVQIAEPYRQRRTANDLARATMGVAADSVTSTNYLGLTGSNILVAVDDTGIDTNHPDLAGRVIDTQGLTDTLGHGTHVAGIIAGSGLMSTTVTNVPGSIMPGTNFQFRGMAPAATLYSLDYLDSDQELQEAAAQTNALISNNSWTYIGANNYDLAAASYDAATRDALPLVTGSQPVLFVFAAGNEGSGDDTSDPGGGVADSIESPATAKDVVTVGAIQENRDITNVVTTITLNSDGTTTTNTSEPWQAETSTDYRVAGFSSRGNVGIGIEGTYGRFKPDVVAPGTFIVSTRSEQWDIGSYFYQDPTNDLTQTYSRLVVQPGSMWNNTFPNVPSNAVQAAIYVRANADSPSPFPFLPIYVALFSTPSGWDFFTTNDQVLIPGSPEAPPGYLQSIINTEGLDPFLGGFYYGVSNSTMNPLSFDLETDLRTTNGTGDYFIVLSNLDQSIGTLNPNSTGPGPYYRYESGTSMSAADVSGVLALMQEFYWNAYHATPSPAMLKAMLINGAQVTGSAYNYLAHNSINYEGWGLVNLPDSLPPGITNQLGAPCSAYLQDQSSTNALATGDSQTFYVTTSSNSTPLRMTLGWTDPPGDPAAAIKLVNNLVLVVTNLSDPANPVVYYGNDFQSSTYNTPHATNTPPVFDTINNIQNVNLRQGTGTNFSVTVLGYRVNVNAVSTQSNNIVQDYALVISTGTTNTITVSSTPSLSTSPPITVSNPTGDQLITQIAHNNAVLLNQFVGANSPLLGTNTAAFSVSAPEGFGPNNWQVTVGQTNQWHFYVVTNSFTNFPNAAFVTFNPNAPEPDTASVPREGVFAGTVQNASRDADIDLYVSTDSSITNLNPSTISNCVILGTQVGASVGVNFANASLGRGTTEFVVDTNSQNNEVYYIGVKSEDQMSAEYGFISIFSATPFSSLKNGTQVVNGVPVPVDIPDGSPHVPGKAYVFGLAIYPMRVGEVTVSNYIYHQNFGDLLGTLTLNGNHPDVLNNHDSFDNPNGFYSLAYDDTPGSTRSSDGPGSLNGFVGQSGLGVWMLTEADNALTQTGTVEGMTVNIRRYQNPADGLVAFSVPAGGWFYTYVDVPPGTTNLTVTATNSTLTTPPLEMFVKYEQEPTTNDFDGMALINIPEGDGNVWGSVSLGPPILSGRYFIGIFNPSAGNATGNLYATIGIPYVPAQTIYNSTDTPRLIPDDALIDDTIDVTDNTFISSLDVAIAVEHPRISDLVFHLISPDGTRVLLMENRGGLDPNGAGSIATFVTNAPLASAFETTPATNYSSGTNVGGWSVTANQVTVQSDPANAYQGMSNYLALADAAISTNLSTIPGTKYTMKLVCRGPGIVSWWRGESNSIAPDVIGGNNGSFIGKVTFTNAMVGQGFFFNGSSYISVPSNPTLQFANSFTLETWFEDLATPIPPGYGLISDRVSDPQSVNFGINIVNNGGLGVYYNDLNYNYPANNSDDLNAFEVSRCYVIPTKGQFYHLAAVYQQVNPTQVVLQTYLNGQLIKTKLMPGTLANTINTSPVAIGTTSPLGEFLSGVMDEVSIYKRALSASEIQAIYNDGEFGNSQGGKGKFDPVAYTNNSPAQSLSEFQVSVAGITTNYYPDNTTWQTKTLTFTATGNSTLVQIRGIEPGVLLSTNSVSALITNYNYLVFTENTNLTTTPIKFAIPPFSPATNLTVVTNVVVPGLTNVTTNTGLFYLPEQPLDAYDGMYAPGNWTLEVQDDRAGATNPPPLLMSWQLRFNYVTLGTNVEPGTPLGLPQLAEQTAYTGLLFTVTNAAFGGTPPYTYALTSSVPFAPFPSIDTNGVITWTPSTNNPAPAVYTFTNIVTDVTAATATDIFQVLLLPTNTLPAFPGAEGPGGTTVGGRGGDVYHVINVNDGGPGSLRYGITNTYGSRTIVFDVSGTIILSNNLIINDPYLTIAGQTAPGDGITIKGYTTSVQDSHDDVIRFLRCRPGDINSPVFQGDSFHFFDVTNAIADHISASWSLDDDLSTMYSTNISVQWSIIADSLNHSAHYMDNGGSGFQAHGYGSLLRYGSGAIGYYHNLYADNYSRNPRPGDSIQLDFINNVVFNWGIFAGYNEDDSAVNPNGYTNYLNYVGNYFIAGSNTTANPNIAFQANVPNASFTQIYQGTNFIDGNAFTNRLNGIDLGWSIFNGNYTQLSAPTSLPGIAATFTNPPDAYEQVLAFAGDTVAGASAGGEDLLRDTIDTNIVTGVRNKSGQIIDFISSRNFSGIYLNTNSESTYAGYTGAGAYWRSQGITNFVGVNPWPVLDSAPQPLDSDRDGIPDYWEVTFAALGQTNMNPVVPNNNHLNPDGYTDLEHYINWLAAPHALTVSNTPVDVNLDAIVGRTGNWSFGVTNAINGTVVLGTNGYIATFTPTNGFIGLASFDFSATNLFTSNSLDVTVSVMVSMTNITYSSVLLTGALSGANSATNTVPPNSIFYYLVKVPTNALFATNQLLSATGPVNLWFSGVGFPTGTNIGDYPLLGGATSGSSVLSTTSLPTNIVQGGTYYLGVQNLGGSPVDAAVEVDFGFTTNVTTVVITGPTITATNINGTNGFLLRWSGPTNYDYAIQWTTNLDPSVSWNTVINPVVNLVATPTNGNYSWFDDGTLAGGFPPVKFYRVLAGLIPGPINTNSGPVTNIIFAGSITPLTVTVPANAIAASNLLISASGPINIYFNQTNAPTTGTNAGDVLMLSATNKGMFVLTGSSVPPLVPGANYYLGLQNPGSSNVSFVFQVNFTYSSSNAPSTPNITFTNIGGTNGFLLTWFAQTNYQYQIQWATSLTPPIGWTTIPGVVLTNLSTPPPVGGIGEFQYFDDGSMTGGFGTQKFYRLVAYPPGTPIPPALVITSVTASPGGLQIQWPGSTNYQYDVQWTTNLALPSANWNVLSNLVSPTLTYSNGICTFTDDGSLTGGTAASKYFKVLLLP